MLRRLTPRDRRDELQAVHDSALDLSGKKLLFAHLAAQGFVLLDGIASQLEFVHEHRSEILQDCRLFWCNLARLFVDDAQCAEAMPVVGPERYAGIEAQSELSSDERVGQRYRFH